MQIIVFDPKTIYAMWCKSLSYLCYSIVVVVVAETVNQFGLSPTLENPLECTRDKIANLVNPTVTVLNLSTQLAI